MRSKHATAIFLAMTLALISSPSYADTDLETALKLGEELEKCRAESAIALRTSVERCRAMIGHERRVSEAKVTKCSESSKATERALVKALEDAQIEIEASRDHWIESPLLWGPVGVVVGASVVIGIAIAVRN